MTRPVFFFSSQFLFTLLLSVFSEANNRALGVDSIVSNHRRQVFALSVQAGARSAISRTLVRTALQRRTRENDHSLLCSSSRSPLLYNQKSNQNHRAFMIPPGGGWAQQKQVSVRKAEDENAILQLAIDSINPGSLSYGFATGFVSGVALKKIGRTAASFLGVGFVTLQVLAYNGFIEVNHSKIEQKFESLLDLNKDGKFGTEDRDMATQKIMEILQYNLPSASGFVVGFVGGIRIG